jgi:hypothetical protein
MAGFGDPIESDIGGTHFMGCGTYAAYTPEQAEAMMNASDLGYAGYGDTAESGMGDGGRESSRHKETEMR